MKKHKYSLGKIVLLAALLTVVAATGYLVYPTFRQTMAQWTGEEALKEQIKGSLALGFLKLTRKEPETAPYYPVAHSGFAPYGVNTFLEQEAEIEKVEESLHHISEAGFHWIRQEFPWEDIEISGKEDFWDHRWNRSAWEKYDLIVERAEAHDLDIIARLDNPPAWSRAVGDAPGWTMAPPDDFEDFGDFVYAVVDRYKGRIRYYQIWNEPNIYPEWGDQPTDPEGYVELLKVAYRRAKEADPNCIILSAGLAQTVEETPDIYGPRNMSDLLYLERMYRAGAREYFDIMGAQAYGLWTGPLDLRTSRDRTNFSRVRLLREIMVQHGDASKPIWATEVGWNAVPKNFEGVPLYGRVTEEDQARYTRQAYQRAAQDWPWMGVMNYWFFRRPSDAERDQSWYYFRMMEPDFTPLPVYHTLSALTEEEPTLGKGFHQETHWALRYDGEWNPVDDSNAVLGSYARGASGSECSFRMSGSALHLVLGDASQVDNVTVYIDGKPRPLRPAGTAPHTQAPALRVARWWRPAVHQVRIVVQKGVLDLDGIVVYKEAPAWGWITLAAVACVLGGIFVWQWRKR